MSKARLSLTLLGDFEARLGSGPPLRLRTRKTEALLGYLALPPGQTHSRDKLASLLWGDRSPRQARSRLRESLFVLRRALASVDPPCLAIGIEAVTLNASEVDVDTVTFVRLTQTGDPEALARAVDLYRGDLLEGLAFRGALFEDWLMTERERLRELVLEALARLLAHQTATAQPERAIQTAVRLLGLDPLQEAVHRTLMRLYARQGRRGAALKQYQLCLARLQRELGAEPEAETKRLYQELLRQPAEAVKAPDSRDSRVRPAQKGAPARLDLPVAETPLFGREAELGRLRQLLDETIGGHGHVAPVMGEAGIGKTRLLSSLAAEALQRGCRVLMGRCHESDSILPFGPWVDACRRGELSADEDLLGALHPTWRAEVTRLLPESTVPGLPLPSDSDLRLFEGMAKLVEQMAARGPLVLMLEDLHWADEMSLRLLAFVSRRISTWPALMVTTARDENLAEAPMLQRTLDELEGEPHIAMVSLGPLSRGHTVSLVQALSRPGTDEAAVARLGEQVWRTSTGNPFVVIETMRAAAQEALSPGLEALPVPERVHDLIGRRLDRFDERHRELVALASVVGRAFEFQLLHKVSGLGEEETARGVEALTRRRVLHNVGDLLDFTHDRVREVAYSRILVPRRKLLHRRVAEALATLYAESLESHHLALGLHYAEGEVWDRAVVHLRRAGARAVERSANREAAACFKRALAALAHLPESHATLDEAFEIRLELRSALNLLGEVQQALECLREADRLAERLNDEGHRGLVCAIITNFHTQLGKLDEALVTGTRALEIALRLGDLGLRVLATSYLEQAQYFRGEYTRAVELATENLAVLPADRIHEHFGLLLPASVYVRAWLVMTFAQLGRFAEATEYAGQTCRIAELTHGAYTLAVAHRAASNLHLIRGDWAKARSLIERWIAVLRTGKVALLLPDGFAFGAYVMARLGEASEALNRLREGEELVERQAARGTVAGRGWAYHALGRASLLLGRFDEAQRLGERAIEYSSQQLGFNAHALHLLGDVATHPDRFDVDDERGEAHYRQALALAQPRGMRPLVAHCHLGLGKLYRRTDKREQAREHFATATTMYREMGMTYWLEKAEPEMKDLGR